ncbi:hypothetical protein [Nocardia sp.]|uniref:hypothetical protein n=1 Tax=Nocardia sp. TaxID=1821 RepID=UPI003F8D9DB1
MTAEAGSIGATGGTATMPAPSRPRVPPEELDPVRTERTVLRLDPPTERDWEPAELRLLCAPDTAVGAALGAVPQISQYPSETVPPHPGSAQTSGPSGALGDCSPPGAAGAVPHTAQ